MLNTTLLGLTMSIIVIGFVAIIVGGIREHFKKEESWTRLKRYLQSIVIALFFLSLVFVIGLIRINWISFDKMDFPMAVPMNPIFSLLCLVLGGVFLALSSILFAIIRIQSGVIKTLKKQEPVEKERKEEKPEDYYPKNRSRYQERYKRPYRQ